MGSNSGGMISCDENPLKVEKVERIDTKRGYMFIRSHLFQGPSFGLSMLVFRDVKEN